MPINGIIYNRWYNIWYIIYDMAVALLFGCQAMPEHVGFYIPVLENMVWKI